MNDKLDSEIAYRKWAVDRLYDHLHDEGDRRSSVENKALRALSFVVIVAGLVTRFTQLPRSEEWSWWVLIFAYVSTVATVFAAWSAVGIRTISTYDPRHLSGEGELESPIAGRLGALLTHLTAVILTVEKQGNKKASAASCAQGCGFVSILCYLYVLATGAFTS